MYLRSSTFDPLRDAVKDSLSMTRVVAHHGERYDRRAVKVVITNLGGRNIELAVKLGQKGLQAAAFLLEGRAIRKVEFQDQRGNMHAASLFTPGVAGKAADPGGGGGVGAVLRSDLL